MANNQHFRTSAEKFISLSVICDCGTKVESEVKEPDDSAAVLTFRRVCPSCGMTLNTYYVGDNAYKPRTETLRLQFGILKIFEENGIPMTVRGVFYRAEVLGLVPKTDQGYNKVQRQLTAMRRAGSIGYGWLADGTRWRRKPESYTGLNAAIERMHNYYRRDFWAEQKVYVEIWLEKDALAGVISPVTSEFDVPLMVSRGFASLSYIYEAAEYIKSIGKPTYIYHFGDHDADGVKAAEAIKEELARQGVDVTFKRVAVTEQQIVQLSLPTRPQKLSSPNAKTWGNKVACELDAIPPKILRAMVRNCITKHIDPEEWERIQKIEKEERQTISLMTNFLESA